MRDYDSNYDSHARSWAWEAFTERIGHAPMAEDIAQLTERGAEARRSLRETIEADRDKENSAEMSVGYGVDCDNEQERLADYRAVRGLKE